MASCTSENPIAVWDFTLPTDCETVPGLKKILRTWCKKWVFQVEEGKEEGHYQHYQARISLKEKTRTPHKLGMVPVQAHFSITSTPGTKTFSYVMKEDTRIDGPWKDTDEEPLYIPRQIREITTLYPWQQKVVDSARIWDTRTINILFDETGNHGKSILKTYVGVHQIGRAIPFVNDYRDIMRIVMDTPKKPLYIIDVPRALRKDQLFQFFSGVETLKDGYAYDDRYHFKEEYFDCPNIWIFMNKLPEEEYLSRDRWKVWQIDPTTGDFLGAPTSL